MLRVGLVLCSKLFCVFLFLLLRRAVGSKRFAFGLDVGMNALFLSLATGLFAIRLILRTGPLPLAPSDACSSDAEALCSLVDCTDARRPLVSSPPPSRVA